MKEWFPRGEIAGLPGCPGTFRGVNKRAVEKNWISRPRKGRGGGGEYHISSLPKVTRIELARREAPSPPPSSYIIHENQFVNLADWQRDRANPRLAILSRS